VRCQTACTVQHYRLEPMGLQEGYTYVLHVDQQVQNQRGTSPDRQGDPLHREWAKQQLAAGVLVQAGKWGDHGGMIVVRAETREEADKVVNQDPARQAGLITFETAQLHAAVAFK